MESQTVREKCVWMINELIARMKKLGMKQRQTEERLQLRHGALSVDDVGLSTMWVPWRIDQIITGYRLVQRHYEERIAYYRRKGIRLFEQLEKELKEWLNHVGQTFAELIGLPEGMFVSL